MEKQEKRIFLVLEDIQILQTYSGFLGKVFKIFYLWVLFFRLNLLLFFLTKKEKVIVLAPDNFQIKENKNLSILYYSDELASIDISKYRNKSLDFFKKLIISANNKLKFKSFNLLEIWQAQITIQLSYYYFPYLEIIEKILNKYQLKNIWVLGNSKEEKIAHFLAKQRGIKIKKFFFLDLSWFDNIVRKKLFSRQLEKKQKDFLSVNKGKLKKENLKNCYLLSADFFRHLKTLVPIYKKIKKRNKKVFFVFDVKKTFKVLKNIYKIDEDFTFLSNYLSLDNSKNDFFKRGIWKEILKKSKKDKQFRNILFSLENFFRPIFSEGLNLVYLYFQASYDFLDNSKIKALIFLNDVRPMEKALMIIGKSKKIKTVVAHSGMFLSTDKTNAYDVDYFSAVGPYIKKELAALGYPSEKIVVNGDPQLDFLAKKKFDKKKILKKLKLNSDKKIILLISDKPNPMLSKDEKKIQFQAVSKAVKSASECQLVIKPHPAEDRQSLMQDLKMWKISDFILTDNKKIEIYDLLNISSVVIIAWSMVGFEAMLFKVPVIVANFSSKNYDLQIPFIKGGGALQIKNIKDLKKYIELLINRKNQITKKQIEKGLSFCSLYYRLPLGGASERIYKLLTKTI